MEWSAPIRRLGPADLKACLALAVDREWPAEERKWTLLLEAAKAYGVDDPGGGLAGAVVLGRYGATLASVGMMLVAFQHGRPGLGRRLMAHVLGQAGDASVFLTESASSGPICARPARAGRAGSLSQASRCRRCSPTRIALAMMVRPGFTAPMLGKKLASTT